MTTEDDALRATPEAIHSFLIKLRHQSLGERLPMPIVVVENVAEFATWGYKLEHEKVADGSLYQGWKDWFVTRTRGAYHPGVEHVLQGLDFGSGSERRRMFVIFTPTDRFDRAIELDLSRVRPVLTGKKGQVYAGYNHNWMKHAHPLPKANQLGTYLVRDFGKRRSGIGYGASIWEDTRNLDTPEHKKKWSENLAKAKKRMPKLSGYWTYSYTSATQPRFPHEPQRTLTAAMGGQLYVVHSKGGRHHQRLCYPEELGRWMGFPSGYILPESATEAGKLVGNAVVPAISEFVLSELMREGAL
jgi:site-specific DNA-cytosine methylase